MLTDDEKDYNEDEQEREEEKEEEDKQQQQQQGGHYGYELDSEDVLQKDDNDRSNIERVGEEPDESVLEGYIEMNGLVEKCDNCLRKIFDTVTTSKYYLTFTKV